MKKLLSIFFLTILHLLAFSQSAEKETKKSIPILYADFLVGWSHEFDKGSRLLGSFGLNYQYKNHLLTLRYIDHLQIETDEIFISPITPIPIVREKIKSAEWAVLYGRRKIYRSSSLSFSTGISHNKYESNFTTEANERIMTIDNYIGVPIEITYIWFKAEEKPIRLFGLIPVGNPTPLGGHFGFKVMGNVSKHSYIGVGLVFGAGVHKNY